LSRKKILSSSKRPMERSRRVVSILFIVGESSSGVCCPG
jgi:hypothetical protein